MYVINICFFIGEHKYGKMPTDLFCLNKNRKQKSNVKIIGKIKASIEKILISDIFSIFDIKATCNKKTTLTTNIIITSRLKDIFLISDKYLCLFSMKK
jgi:hypothetical protein